MPRLTGHLAQLEFNLDAQLKKLDKKAKDVLTHGVSEWVRTVASIVPTWSGMSLASLKPIANLAGVPLFVGVAPTAPDRRSAGEALGEAKLEITKTTYAFEWRSRVFHFIYNEFNNANLVGFRLKQPGPYHSMKAAEEAFLRVMNSRLKELKFDVQDDIKINRKDIR
jgi:hypothetical protein